MSFLQHQSLKNDLTEVRRAIRDFLQVKSNLLFSDSEQALKDLDEIEKGLGALQQYLNKYRVKRMPIFGYSKQERRGGSEGYASDLGRRGQLLGFLKNEQLQLQNQLGQLSASIPDLRKILVNRMNSSVKVGSQMISQASSVKEHKDSYISLHQGIAIPLYPAIGAIPKPSSPDIAFVAATLAALLYTFIKKNR